MVERYTREDGKIAVLISPGYGSGWSTSAPDEDSEALLFDARIVKAVLAGLHHAAGSLAIMQTYHPRQKPSDISGSESNESDSEMTMSTIINNELDTTGTGADSKGADPAGMIDAKAKDLNTEPIDCGNPVARSKSAKQAEYDASKNAAVSENGMESDDGIDPSYWDSYENHANTSIYYRSARKLKIEWLDPGEEFMVNEYDGYESILRKRDWKPLPWYVA